MPLAATIEQRINGTIKALVRQGLTVEDATRQTYGKFGVPIPPSPVDPVDQEKHVEDLHWQLACERRRADACAARARILTEQLRALRRVDRVSTEG